MIIKRINNTKTIAAPDTPELHICHTSFLIFSRYCMFFFNICAYIRLKLLFFFLNFDMIYMYKQIEIFKGGLYNEEKIISVYYIIFYGYDACVCKRSKYQV